MVIKQPHGRLYAERYDGRWYITSVMVDEPYREHGIGTALMREAVAKTGRPLLLFASPEYGSDIRRLRRFYRRFGFRTMRQPKDTFPYRYNMILEEW